jgi:hypothetical protein
MWAIVPPDREARCVSNLGETSAPRSELTSERLAAMHEHNDEFERLVTGYFRRERERNHMVQMTKAILARLEPLPRQVRSFSIFDDVLLQWNLDIAWSRVVLLSGSAVIGLLMGGGVDDQAVRSMHGSYQTAVVSMMAALGSGDRFERH